MSKRRLERVQDAVHGLMKFRGMETAVIRLLETRELQRLRRISQLGLASLVYPGAEHSRHAHSLGTAYLAIRFGRQLQDAAVEFLPPLMHPGPVEIRDLAIAALCHDLGHGPFSHTWEDQCIGKRDFDSKRDQWAEQFGMNSEDCKELKWHEIVGRGLLLWPGGDLHNRLKEHDESMPRRIQALLGGGYHVPYLSRLLSSDIDVDRGDFLLRDAIQCGVSYGRYDLEWLLSCVTLGYYNDNVVIGFDLSKSRRVIEEFALAHRAHYETVYFHHTVKSAELMLGLFFKRLKWLARERREDLERRFPRHASIITIAAGDVLGPEQVLELDDVLLWSFLSEVAKTPREPDDILCDLAWRLLQRNLFKAIELPRAESSLPLPTNEMLVEQGLRLVSPRTGRKLTREEFREYYLCPFNQDRDILSTKDHDCGFFIDTTRPDRPAIMIQRDREFRALRTMSITTSRIYVPREVRDEAKKILSSRRTAE
ncbi:MAG: HD domain-containing protein [Myxococcales bacterium]|nr:HD domain-containing protein [Myxococcales bacterium]